MAVDIRLPELAASMTSATLRTWLKQPGEAVAAGEPIAEVETDKTTVELEAPADGILADVQVPDGTEDVPVGTLLAVIAPGVPDAAPPAEGVGGDGGAREVPAASPDSPVADRADHRVETPPAGPPPADAGESPPLPAGVAATPLARRMAAWAGLDLAAISPEGAGRITRNEVERMLPGPPAPAPVADRSRPVAEASSAAPGATAAAPAVAYLDFPLTPTRRVIAERMSASKQTAPHFYLELDCAVDDVLARRAAVNAAVPEARVTMNDVIVRAAALAFAAVPAANAVWMGDAIRQFEAVDIAVAVTTARGLVTPIVRSAETKDLAAIAAELRGLTRRARAGRLSPAETAAGTCTISNLGMFGVSRLYAILNPPQSCILGVGAIAPRAVVREGTVGVASMMAVTLSADHRVLDGATGAELLRAVKHELEDPRQIFA